MRELQHLPGAKERNQYRQERKSAEWNTHNVFQASLDDEFPVNFCNEKQGTKVHKEDIDVAKLFYKVHHAICKRTVFQNKK